MAVALVSCGGGSGNDAADGPTITTQAERPSTTAAVTSTTETTSATTPEEPSTTTAAPTDDKAICPTLKRLGEVDAKAQATVATGDWARIKAFYVDETATTLAIYDDAIGFETELTPDLKTLRAVSVATRDVAAKATSFMAFTSGLMAMPEAATSGAAALNANAYAKKTCGFPLASF